MHSTHLSQKPMYVYKMSICKSCSLDKSDHFSVLLCLRNIIRITSSEMAVLYVGDSIFKYLRINRFGSRVVYSSGARVEQLPGGLHHVGTFQVSDFSILH